MKYNKKNNVYYLVEYTKNLTSEFIIDYYTNREQALFSTWQFYQHLEENDKKNNIVELRRSNKKDFLKNDDDNDGYFMNYNIIKSYTK